MVFAYVEDDVAEGEDPERHHEEGREGWDGRHRDGQVQVTAEHQGPENEQSINPFQFFQISTYRFYAIISNIIKSCNL